MHRSGLRVILAVMIVTPLLHAEAAGARISLPLEGYYRPGRSMPVRIEEPGQSTISLRADLAVPSDISPGWRGVAPFFVIGASRESELLVEEAGGAQTRFALHALQPNERLVGLVAGDESAARSLFPGSTVITIHLSPGFDPLKSLTAFQSLDAIVLREVTQQDLLRYSEAGVTVAVIGRERPEIGIPWQQVGDCWIFQSPQAGPDSIIGGESVYLPAQGWRQAASSRFRLQIVLSGVIVVLLLLACLLLRGGAVKVAAALGVSIMSCLAIASWKRAAPTASTQSGNIVVASDGLVQTDHWEYIAAGTEGSGHLFNPDQPVVYDLNHLRALDLRLQVQSDGTSRWSFAIPPEGKLAVLRRRIEFGTVPTVIHSGVPSRLETLARNAYVRAGFKIAGELRSPKSEWGTTVIVPDSSR